MGNLTRESIIDNITLYWLTGTGASVARWYWEFGQVLAAAGAAGKAPPAISVPVAGVWTSVCLMFPALDAKVVGYKVYAVMDASGDVSEMSNRTTLARFVQGGVIPVTTNAVLLCFEVALYHRRIVCRDMSVKLANLDCFRAVPGPVYF